MTDGPPGGRAYQVKPIIAYTDPLSVQPGQHLSVMVSTIADTYNASLVRMRHGDPHPDGPGLRYTTIPSAIDGDHPGAYQPLRLGSYVRIPHHDQLEPTVGFTWQTWIYPTLTNRGVQGVVTKRDSAHRGYGLFIEDDGCLSLRVDGRVYSSHAPLRPREWYFAAVTFDAATSTATLQQVPLRSFPQDPARAERTFTGVTYTPTDSPLLFAASSGPDGQPVAHYNGKIDSPRFYAQPLTTTALAALAAGDDAAAHPALVADWDLLADADSDTVPNRTNADHAGTTINRPTKAVTGRNWTGTETAFHRVPEQYNALYFHDDDLDDAHWEPSLSLTVPEDLTSGIYAIRLRAAEAEDWVPFFVRPERPGADVVFLAPTLSYLAYANEHSAADNPAAAVDFDIRDFYQAEDHYAINVPVTGLYDHHPDGTGVCYSTWLRPVANMRPHYHLPLVRSAHQFSADLHLIDWLEHNNVNYDVVTDHDLHEHGADLLSPYQVTLTGSHPEYWTNTMLNALEHYLGGGGRLMYLGGNGFYWVTSLSPSHPDLIEVRRGRRGTGTWRSAPGEDYHATTGELGGLWRDRGRPPQQLVAVGMAAQGFDCALPYTRTAASNNPEVAWILDGVDNSSSIGDHGLVMGGAAGLELDRADRNLETSANAIVLATATGFSDSYQHVVEEVSSSDSRQGGSVSPEVRADMTYCEGPNGSAVFSTGSIAWSGALSINNYDNPVSRITRNVLDRFRS